ncbi:MAG: amidohydrolase family protein, partial [Clostridia bacterium]|nr:amidohydrolase family protein [Clostridia bacterium]
MKGFVGVKAYIEGKGIVKTNVGFENGKIAYIGNDNKITEVLSLPEDAVIVPGFIDEHIHGAAGSDAMDGTTEALSTIANAIASEGTTGFLATTMTQSPENIKKAMRAVKDYKEENRADGAAVLGIHLEGPFISVKHVGAQPIEYVQTPSVKTFKEYNKESGNSIKLVTLAPEVEGADELVSYLKENGIVASIGHTDATYADVKAAIESGATNITHTYNAQKALHHREIGTVGSAFLFDELN